MVKPLAVDETRVTFLSYVWDPSRLDRGAGAGLDRVEREDESVVESVQKGVRSRLYERGRTRPPASKGCTTSTACSRERCLADLHLEPVAGLQPHDLVEHDRPLVPAGSQ